MTTTVIYLLYFATGSVAGVLAGLLGIGGAVVIVPVLAFLFAEQEFPREHIMHLALGTCMASIIATAISSASSHHRKGAVRWNIVTRIAPGIILGSLAGALLASWLNTDFLRVFFVFFLYAVAAQMLFGVRPPPTHKLPEGARLIAAGFVIGVLSSLVGIGGGALSVPYMVWCNIALHQAVATSAAIGFPVAIGGTIGYIFGGWGLPLPEPSLGFIYLPALLSLVLGTVLTAPLGAHLAHSLPVNKLKRIFGIALLFIGTRMLWALT